ncbi:hypothetical protein [Salinimicrobium terrae]|uniref:hypothetical protein n=1 Tax=Salinimicrobium terrae TaxID=470866 RepID=UPI000406E94F|nr:hypothetical protein [Salinimicrobium terrae]
MRKTILYTLILLLCLACKNDAEFEAEDPSEVTETTSAAENGSIFSPEKWKTKDGFDYPHRNRMLKDLMTDEDFRSLKRNEVLDLLGEPDRIDTNYLFYRVEQKRLSLWPIHTKTMVVKFTQDSLIEWIKIHE